MRVYAILYATLDSLCWGDEDILLLSAHSSDRRGWWYATVEDTFRSTGESHGGSLRGLAEDAAPPAWHQAVAGAGPSTRLDPDDVFPPGNGGDGSRLRPVSSDLRCLAPGRCGVDPDGSSTVPHAGPNAHRGEENLPGAQNGSGVGRTAFETEPGRAGPAPTREPYSAHGAWPIQAEAP